MGLYSNFTLKEWLSLNCLTKDVEELFRKALRDNDEPMAVLALAELIKRGDEDLVTRAISDACEAGYLKCGSHFSAVFANALTNLGGRDPFLRRIAKGAHKKGYWPTNMLELIEDTELPSMERTSIESLMMVFKQLHERE